MMWNKIKSFYKNQLKMQVLLVEIEYIGVLSTVN